MYTLYVLLILFINNKRILNEDFQHYLIKFNELVNKYKEHLKYKEIKVIHKPGENIGHGVQGNIYKYSNNEVIKCLNNSDNLNNIYKGSIRILYYRFDKNLTYVNIPLGFVNLNNQNICIILKYINGVTLGL